ncbi:site-specific integrase [Ramlibacter henchirensis]|uniref:Site-specific integrase n=1 Tax=Ramlibacter henchirensis TaxID=204072 RepID=A0A4Z0BPB1_9BURK|nr:site-specific integrase [Ramlibacter henchirensis]TFZ00661.1 site-specific integrase [Ramlibacter henchirensis]
MQFDLAAAVKAIEDRPPSNHTLRELVQAFSAATAGDADLRLRKWLDAFGELPAWDVKADELQKAADAMRQAGYAPASVNRDLSALGSAYKWAKKNRLCPRGFVSPTTQISRSPEPIRRVHVEPAVIDAVRKLALIYPDARFGVYVSLLIDTGARKSELLRRYGRDLDLERCEVLAPVTKNGTPRVLMFRDSTSTLIRRVYKSIDPDRLLFEGRVRGQPINFRKAWEFVTREAGRPDLRMHDLRHVRAADLLRSGESVAVAAQVLGHDAAVLTRRYGHLETRALRQAQERSWAQAA